MTETKYLDPSTLGFFLVAVVALPLALAQLIEKGGPTANFFMVIGLLIFFVAVWAWKCGSNFGFTVFGLVAAAVFLTGYGMGYWENISFGIVFAFAAVWTILLGAGKNLTLIAVVTSLLFLFVGFSNGELIGGDYWRWLIGLDALVLFVLAFYMACSCAAPEKFKPF